MVKKRKKTEKIVGEIYIFGHIDEETAKKIIETAVRFENNGLKIEMYINTSGGDPFSALAIYDYIRGLSSHVTTIAIGHVDSAGILIFLAGDKRAITQNASIMLHRSRVFGATEMHRDTADQIAKDIGFIEDKKVCMIVAATKLSKKEVRNFVASGKRFTAEEAVECGLAHKII